ncbi:MAG: monooxygenase [Sphingobacteriales bacterium]|nr:MAG: monooxygenase [Sphingobacteriales bacterium]
MIKKTQTFPVIIVGAGAAGVGVGIALKDFGIKHFTVLEADVVGSSFINWPHETQFITPSFPSTSFGLIDYNAIALNTSPALTSGKQHLRGIEYAAYLNKMVQEFDLNVNENCKVLAVEKRKHIFVIETNQGSFQCQYLIWATGEYKFPQIKPFKGAELCTTFSSIKTYKNFTNDNYIVIGAYESGIDVAYNLSKNKEVEGILLIDKTDTIKINEQDPSLSISPYSRQKILDVNNLNLDKIVIYVDIEIDKVVKTADGYSVFSKTDIFKTTHPPILCTGFLGGEHQISNLFDFNENGKPVLNQFDESVKTKNLYLVGPHVQHQNVIFCFIYKFRQRFAIVANNIGKYYGLDNSDMINKYRKNVMYLDDLTCCEHNCLC